MSRLLALAVVTTAAAASDDGATWTLRLVDPGTGGLCLDGSPSGYWIRNGTGADARKFIIHLQGGGVRPCACREYYCRLPPLTQSVKMKGGTHNSTP